MKTALVLASLALTLVVACSSPEADDASAAESAMRMPHPVVASTELVAKEGQADALVAALAVAEIDTRAESGVLYANIHRDLEHPDRFLALAVFRDEGAFEAHVASPHAQTFFASVGSDLAAPALSRKFAPSGSLDLGRMRAVAKDPNAVYTYVVAHTADAAAKTHLMGFMPATIPISRAQCGSRFYDILDSSEPTTFASYESWSSAEAEQAHLASAPITSFLANVSADLEGPPVFRHFTSLAH